jgi:hypothetical protein
MAISSNPGVKTPGYFPRNAESLRDRAPAVVPKWRSARDVVGTKNWLDRNLNANKSQNHETGQAAKRAAHYLLGGSTHIL